MGAVWMTKDDVVVSTGELVGFKSGLALNRQQLKENAPEEFHSIWDGESKGVIRIRSEEFENLIHAILYRIGNIPSPNPLPPVLEMRRRIGSDNAELTILFDLLEQLSLIFRSDSKVGKIDLTPLVELGNQKYGLSGVKIALMIHEVLLEQRQTFVFARIRRLEWTNTEQLSDLFSSESLSPMYGKFIDQRYIDYLQKNFEDISKINWRKFEALTCEFFDRCGYVVTIGPGRNDDGIDARIWPQNGDTSHAPLAVVQCRRQNKKVEKATVKALYADVLKENAQSGLIVTTSSLEEGARKVCTARAYPIDEANRDTLRKWIDAMRTPFSGV